MKRRHFIVGLALAATAVTSFAQSTAIVVVKVINFSCPVCRASESQDAPVIVAADQTGGQFVYAPIPAEAGEFAKEKVYYAIRKQGRAAEKRVRESLYRGAQDMNMPFLDVIQVIEWLKDDIPDLEIDWLTLTADAQGPDAKAALRRAALLTKAAGAQVLPSYIVVQNNAPVATLDINTSGKGSSLVSLRDEVIKRVGELSGATKTKETP